MAYSKTVWNNNTPPDISAENLNKMEQGIADAQFPDGGSTGQILSKTNDGTGWVDAPTSAEWGNIEGQLSEQTDLYSELESKITMPSGGTTGQVLTKTASGQAWDDVEGLPSGGTAGQVLTKNSSTSGDASWQDVDGLPAGGTAGQVLTKNSSTDGDASWQTSPSGGGGTWGSITGTLANQTDLSNALSAKANASNLATIESSTTASQAYAVGDYLVLNGQLYEVIADIASGETLVVGTNISARTVGEELTALNNGLRTFTPVSAVGDRATGLSGGYAYLNDHTVLVQLIGTMNLNTNNAYEFAFIQGLPNPWINAALSLNILNVGSLSGFASTARVGTDGAITVSISKSADNVYGKAFCISGLYYVS